MATFDYAKTQATAERLLARFGQTVTLRKAGATTGDAWAPVPGTPSDTDIIVADFEERRRDEDGRLTGEAMRTLYVSTSTGVAPEPNDQVQIGGEWHVILAVRPLRPAGTALLYEADLAA